MSIRSTRLLTAAMLLTMLLLLPAAPALAHEGRRIGDLELQVGFGTEPAYAGEVNSVQLIVVHHGDPVLDVADTLEVEVSFGDETIRLPLEPAFGSPGEYRAWFIPTASGQYAFHLTGTIDDEEVDETFTSGPDTFSDVQDPATIAFPAVDAPTTTELAELIGRVEPRLSGEIDDARAAALARADEVADDASSAQTFGLIGLIVGGLGLVVAIVAFVASRKRAVARA
ncbi:MAG: hypothetical protein L0206_24615 [Actinobacteria bacterium]|nr:hypothetical protein [Actinomycetota bacterium]